MAGVALGASPCWRFHAVEDEWVDVEMTDVFGDWRMQMEWISPTGRSAGTSTGTVFDRIWIPYETGTQTISSATATAGSTPASTTSRSASRRAPSR